jgi:hypothetical protein
MSEDDEKVGNRQPPVSHRFKSGQSGNPRGRPKGTRNLRGDLNEMLERKVSVIEGGKKKAIRGQEALLLTAYKMALAGDVRAMNTLFNMLSKLVSTDVGSAKEEPTESDARIVEAFLQRHMKSRSYEK